MIMYKEQVQIVTFWFWEFQTGLAEHHARRAGENPGTYAQDFTIGHIIRIGVMFLI